tara:strand:+ start:6887 stop:7408 length:522 start_codon:yes stop_codon:yes gene_type:complete
MKKFFYIIFFFTILSNANADLKIVYIDINEILTNSKVGKSITEYMTSLEKNKIAEFDQLEKKLKNKDKEIIAKKNILNDEELQNEINSLKKDITKYKNDKKNFIDELNKKKLGYTKIVLNKLNSIISKYVDENSISIVFPKKSLVVAKKDLDITSEVMDLLNRSLTKIDFTNE